MTLPVSKAAHVEMPEHPHGALGRGPRGGAGLLGFHRMASRIWSEEACWSFMGCRDSVVQAFCQIAVEPGGQDGAGGARVVVVEAVELQPPVGVERQEGKPWIPVPGLADRAGVIGTCTVPRAGTRSRARR